MSLLSLPNELIEHLLLYLDVSSTLALASTCTRNQDILAKPVTFKSLLKRTSDNTQNIETIIEFLGSVSKLHHLGELLYKKILQAFPAIIKINVFNSIRVTSTMFHMSENVRVSLQGVLLLIKLAQRCGQGLPLIKEVEMGTMKNPALLALASCIQEQEVRVDQLWMFGDIACRTEEEGLVLVQLLSSCSSWFVSGLDLHGEVDSVSWERLAKTVTRGNINAVYTSREVMARGRKDDVRKVWRRTGLVWKVERERAVFNGDVKGWRRLEQLVW